MGQRLKASLQQKKKSFIQTSSLKKDSEGVYSQVNKEKEDSRKVANQQLLKETKITASEQTQNFNNDLGTQNMFENNVVQSLKVSSEKEKNQKSLASLVKSGSSNRNLGMNQTPANKNPVVVAGTFHPFPDPKKPEIAVSALAQDRLRQQQFHKLSPSRVINQVEPLPGPQKARVIPMQKGMPHPSATSSQVSLKAESVTESKQNKLVKLKTLSIQDESKVERETDSAEHQAQSTSKIIKSEEKKIFPSQVEEKTAHR